MGHHHSSAQRGGHSGFSAAHRGIVASAPTSGARNPIRPLLDLTTRTRSFSAYILLFLLRCYMILLSPFFGGACKFEPSCSNYAYEAIALHGARRGSVLAMKRLVRCRPFTVGGFDPVPDLAPVRRARQELVL